MFSPPVEACSEKGTGSVFKKKKNTNIRYGKWRTRIDGKEAGEKAVGEHKENGSSTRHAYAQGSHEAAEDAASAEEEISRRGKETESGGRW